MLDHKFTTGTDNPDVRVANDSHKAVEDVQSHPPAQLRKMILKSCQAKITKLEYSGVKRQKVEGQLGNDTPIIKVVNLDNCVKDILALFKEQRTVLQ